MTDLILYDLKVAALLCVFYIFYKLLLACETTHTLNRAVLLLCMALSVVLPLCIVTLHKTVVFGSVQQPMKEIVADGAALTMPEALQQGFDWSIPLAAILIAGTIIRLLYLAHGYWKLSRMIRHGEKHTLPSGTRVCVIDAPIAPFTWMQTIALSRADWQLPSAAILAHEEAHVRHRHSNDVVVVEVLTALQWFDPVVWFMRQELNIVHEYEADASVLSRGFDESQYIHLLMQKATGMQAGVLARSTLVACFSKNGIHTHKTKKRILMMLKPKSSRTAWLKALYAVPIVLVSLAMTARTVVDYEATTKEEEETVKYSPKMSDAEFVIYAKQQKAAGLTHSALTQIMLNEGGGISRAHILHLNGVYGSEKGNLLVVDGKEVSREEYNQLQPQDIASVTVMDVGPAKKTFGEKGRYGATVIETKQTASATPKQEDPVFDVCEQMPLFPGGEAELMQFLARNMKYPQVAIDNDVQGRVLVQFIVEKDGSLSNMKVLESPKGSQTNMVVVTAYMPDEERQDAEAHNAAIQALRDEAIRVVNTMPRWEPGRQRGKTVRCHYVIPVTYRLS